MEYSILFNLAKHIELELFIKEISKQISAYSVDVVPDDYTINIVLIKYVPIKSIKVNYLIRLTK